MALLPPEPDLSRLVPLAQKLEALDDQAWERISTRCAELDRKSLDGLIGRAELVARSIVPVTNPYAEPGLQPALSAWFTGLGMLGELAALLGSPNPDLYEREAAKLRQKPGVTLQELGRAALLSIQARAIRQRPRHAGLAAAIQAVAYAVLSRRRPDANLEAVYAPFEPEIPYASLQPPGQHAA